MKNSGVLFSLMLGVSLLTLTSCGKNGSTSKNLRTVSNTIEVPKVENKADTIANHNVKAVNLRLSENFAVFANTSISSIPNSVITGKVGLRPGVRALIGLDPIEVVGGLSEIYAGDDNDY